MVQGDSREVVDTVLTQPRETCRARSAKHARKGKESALKYPFIKAINFGIDSTYYRPFINCNFRQGWTLPVPDKNR